MASTVFVSFIALFMSYGCMHWINPPLHTPYVGQPDQKIQLFPPEHQFARDERPIFPSVFESRQEETASYKIFYLSFSSVGANGQDDNLVTVKYFSSKSHGRKKLVIILPIYGSSEFPSLMTALHLTELNGRGDTNVMVIEGKNDLVDWNGLGGAKTEAEFQTIIREAVSRAVANVRDYRRLLDWVEVQPEIDSGRIGIVGFSIGTLIAPVLMAVDQRISTGIFVMGGGDINDIISYDDTKAMREMRNNILKNLSWNQEMLSKKLKPLFDPINPNRFAPYINPSRILFFDAKFDEYIREKSREGLWHALGRPYRITFPYRHKTSFIVFMTFFSSDYIEREIVKFFHNNL